MAYKMKGHTLPGINQKGNKGMEDGRANSSPFQQGEKSEIRAHNFRAPAPNPEAKMSRIGVDKRPYPKTPDFPPRLERGKPTVASHEEKHPLGKKSPLPQKELRKNTSFKGSVMTNTDTGDTYNLKTGKTTKMSRSYKALAKKAGAESSAETGQAAVSGALAGGKMKKPVKKEGGSSTKGKGTIYKQMTR
mgnify:CR=1 FL=1|tara:strand:- start:298 stop:867 length:570 start_codon:yes stop_codon:yes gene_type:complete